MHTHMYIHTHTHTHARTHTPPHLPSATNRMASACVVSTGAVHPSTSPGDSGLQPGMEREGKVGARAARAAWTAEENWMVPASTCGGRGRGWTSASHQVRLGVHLQRLTEQVAVCMGVRRAEEKWVMPVRGDVGKRAPTSQTEWASVCMGRAEGGGEVGDACKDPRQTSGWAAPPAPRANNAHSGERHRQGGASVPEQPTQTHRARCTTGHAGVGPCPPPTRLAPGGKVSLALPTRWSRSMAMSTNTYRQGTEVTSTGTCRRGGIKGGYNCQAMQSHAHEHTSKRKRGKGGG